MVTQRSTGHAVADTFAGKLGRLVEQRREQQGPLSYKAIAAGITALGGPAVSAAYLQQLVTGKRRDPKISYVQAFARYFDVPVTYFFEDSADELTDSDARVMVMRAECLSTEGRRQVMGLIDYVWRTERSAKRRA